MEIAWTVLAQFVCLQLISGAVVNVALRKPVHVSSRHLNRDPAIAVNGDTTAVDTCCIMHTLERETTAWWWVDLQTQVQDATVKIYFRTDYTKRRNGVSLYTSTTPFSNYPSGDLCHRVTGNPNELNVLDVVSVNCKGTWRYLMVYTQTDNDRSGAILDFGEVQVLGCDNTYGVDCDKSCNSRQCAQTPASCNRYTGACPRGGCKAGWMGSDCTQACSSGYYGSGCKLSCGERKCRLSSTCNTVTGLCVGGCLSGWSGTDCKQACPSGYYGFDCNLSCGDRKCRLSSTCDPVTGLCDGGCLSGWSGTDCKQACSSGYYGFDCNLSCGDRKCRLSSTCDPVTGQCVGGCSAGWTGTDCKQECTQATNYGANCSKSCSARQCRTLPTSCDPKTGHCPNGCQGGWRGEDCTIQCPEGTFGLGCLSCRIRHCEGEFDCPADGTCSSGCQDGWLLSNCTQACPSGTYGPGCVSVCGNCTGDDICNHTNGNCPGDCKAGWRGVQCTNSCEKSYGVNCKNPCGQCIGDCNSVDGQCPGECQEGYNGTYCQVKLQETGPQSTVIPAVVGALVGLLVVVVITVVFIVYRRRRSSSSKTYKDANKNSQAAPDGGNVYANVNVMEEESTKTEKPPIHEKQPVGMKTAVHEKPPVQEKPPIREKPKLALLPKQLQSETDTEEEILDEVDQSPNRDYYNDSAVVIHDIPVAELEATVLKIKCSKGGFEAEYNRLPTGFTAPYSDSQKPENAGKNKFRGYYPYDHNRVRLSSNPDIPGSDYINASLMHSYDRKKTYIAAQAPNKKTVGDFWRMIWEHRCGRVIMLTGLVEAAKVKCYQYWPDKEPVETDHFQVDIKKSDIRANYTVRHLKVTSKDKGDSRTIVQYHYTSWPDHDVPDTLALVNFIWMMRRTDAQTGEPLLVHCSAGIGRTGTYIAVDSLLDQARGEGIVDVLGYVSVMRGQRKNMIQTKEQYECVFKCLTEMTKFGDTSMDSDNFNSSFSNRGMDSIVDKKTLREITQMTVKENRNDSSAKHQMWVDGNQNFIVRVGPSLRHIRGYLQAVTPTSGVISLLWKLVDERNVHNVFAATPLQVEVAGDKGSKKKYGEASVTSTSQTSLTPDLTMATLQLRMNDNENSQDINLFKSSRSPTLDIVSSLLLDHAHLQHLSADTSPVVLIHGEPDRKCAVMFCIMSNILSGIMEDSRVDVIGPARAFLKCCPDLAFTGQDFEMLFQFAQKCVEKTGSSNTYANL